jgi:diguanylate cyclase (GGDEF)-like protein/PAS domain S-box-containing protein
MRILLSGRLLCSLLLFALAWALQPSAFAQGPAQPQAASAAAATAAAEPGVLVLLSTGYGQAGIDSYVKGFYEVMRERGIRFNRIHIEYLDLVKNSGPAYRRELADLLNSKYGHAPLRAIVTMQPPALDFLLKDGAAIGRDAPVLVAQARLPKDAPSSGRSFHFQTPVLAFSGTLERALELLPATRRVYLLSGNSALEQERLADARRQFEPYASRFDFVYLDGKPFDEIEREIAAAPPHSIVIAPGVNRDGRGQVMVPVDSIVRVAKLGRAPVFPVYAGSMGQGPIGGMVSVLEDEGRSMARSVLELLDAQLPVPPDFRVQTARPVPMFDWREIERWDGDWRRLPPDTVYLHRPPSLWNEYRGYVIGAGAALAVLSLLVVALAVQNRRRELAERSLRASQARYQLLADNMSDVLWVMDVDGGRIEYLSPSVQQLLGYSSEEFAAQGFGAAMPEKLYQLFLQNNAARAQLFRQQPEEQRRYTDVLELKHRDGSLVWTESVTHYLRNDAGAIVIMGVTRDITQRMRAQAEINRLAFYDGLTQLPNRKLLQDRAQQAVVVSGRSHRHGALLFVDLDHFKTLNDTRGHEVGDQLLRQVAQRLATCLRAGDTLARLGGDEFVVLLEDLSEESARAAAEAKAVGDKMLAALEPEFALQGQDHHITASIGVALFVGAADSYDELLKRADLAMYRAKSAGRNALCFYDPQMQAIVSARAALEADLRRGLQLGELELYYQPLVLADGRVVGAEALVRWQRPGHGMASPAEFIPLAEETGLIKPLGLWVLQTACRQLVAWAANERTRGLSISVNVSPRQFRHADFVASVLATLAQSGARASLLKLELTESLMLEDVEGTIAKMNELKSHGVSFSLDDFGTGYSSLAYLKRLPLDQLKIDRSFVRDVLTDFNDAAIARTVLALGHSLGLPVVAEGVETEGQREFLVQHGCQAFQGYLFGKPMPVAEFEQALSEGTAGSAAQARLG